MVVKTTQCAFSEHKIYPGHGMSIFRRDGKSLTFASKKACITHSRGTNPTRITWTTAWRRLNKKITTTVSNKKKRSKKAKILRPIEGLTLEDIMRKREEKPAFRVAMRDEQKRAIQEKKKKQIEEKKKENKGKAKKQIEEKKSRKGNARVFNKARR